VDYSRIYSEFIADRKRREAGLIGYAERHHVLPRCMGGGEEAQNLIRLIPEDHFFAHLLLAKIHGGQLWAPVAFMVGGQRKDWQPCKSRRSYAWAVREMAKARMGAGAYQFDRSVYRLSHDDLGEWSGLQSDFEQLGISRSLGNMLIKGRVRAAKGWYIEGQRPAWLKAGGRPGSLHYAADSKEYHFQHVDGREFSGTRLAFRKMSGVSGAGTTGLLNGSRTISRGWHLHGVTPKKKGRAGAYAR
jgi:hypothetical protein